MLFDQARIHCAVGLNALLSFETLGLNSPGLLSTDTNVSRRLARLIVCERLLVHKRDIHKQVDLVQQRAGWQAGLSCGKKL